MRIETILFGMVVLLTLVGSSSAYEGFDGVERVRITVGSKDYLVPVGNNDRRNDLFYIKKALNGDKEAREVFLAGEDERAFFIGDYKPSWLVISKTGESIHEI